MCYACFKLKALFLSKRPYIPLPIQVDGPPEFEVNSILDSRFRRRKLHYLVDWVGYDESERTWEPAENITNARDAISDFQSRFSAKPCTAV